MFTDVKNIDEENLYTNALGRIVDAICESKGTENYKNVASSYYEQLLEIRDALLGTPGVTVNAIKEGTADKNKTPKNYLECLEAIRSAHLGKEWTREKFLWSCLGPVAPKTDLLGKTASELGTCIRFTDNGFVKGTVNYVRDYTGFNESNKEEQEGYYLAFSFKPNEHVTEAYFRVLKDNKDAKPFEKGVTCDTENVAFLGKTLDDVLKRRIVIAAKRDDGVDEKVYLNMNDLTVGPIIPVTLPIENIEDLLEEDY